MKIRRKFLFFVLSVLIMLSSFGGLTRAQEDNVIQWVYDNNEVENIQRNNLDLYRVSLRIDKTHLEQLLGFTINYTNDIEIRLVGSNLSEDNIMIDDHQINVPSIVLPEGIENLEIEFEFKPSIPGISEVKIVDHQNIIINTLTINTEESSKLNDNDLIHELEQVESSHEIDQNALIDDQSLLSEDESTVPMISDFPILTNASTREEKLDITDYFTVPTLHNASNSAYTDPNTSDTVVITNGKNNQFGVMWSNFKIDLTKNFEISAQVKQSSNNTSRADGLALVLQSDARGNKAYGSPGWGLGVYGKNASEKVNNALSFEIDTYMNGAGYDYCKNVYGINCASSAESINTGYYPGHIAVVETNFHIGSYSNISQTAKVEHQKPIQLTFNSGGFVNDWVPLTVKWNAVTQTLTYVYNSNNTIEYKVTNLTRTFGGTEVYLGFTGSTGGYVSTQEVRLIKIPGARVEAQYLDYETRSAIIDSKKLSGNLGQMWATESVEIPHYELVGIEGPESGEFTASEQIVKYYYKKIRYDINVVKQSDQMINDIPALLSGAKFELKDTSSNASHSLVESASNNGNYSLNGVMEQGKKYILTEVSPPPGHTFEDQNKKSWNVEVSEEGRIYVDGVEVSVSSNRSFNLNITNKFIPIPINVLKYSSESMLNEVLPGATFELCLYNDLSNLEGPNPEECISSHDGVTNDEGLVNFIINKPGDYYIRETASPTGFKLDDSKKLFNVNLKGEVKFSSNENVIENDGVLTVLHANALNPFNLTINKLDENGLPLDGAVFKLSKDGVELETIGLEHLTNTFNFTNLQVGSYTLEEVGAPKDYYPLENPITIEINALGEVTMSDNTEFTLTQDNEHSSNLISMNIINRPIPKFAIEFYKVNQDDDPLGNVVFNLFSLDDENNIVSQIPLGSTSQNNGLVSFGILPSGKYKLVEVSTLSGYELPLGYWIIDYDNTQDEIKNRMKIEAQGDSLPPAFKFINVGEKDAYALTNYKLNHMPMVGKIDYFLFPMIGILVCGFAGVYLLMSDRSAREKKQADKARGK